MEAGGLILPSQKTHLPSWQILQPGAPPAPALGSKPLQSWAACLEQGLNASSEAQDLYFRETLQTSGGRASSFAQLSVKGMSLNQTAWSWERRVYSSPRACKCF